MLLMSFFRWWYGEGWRGVIASLPQRLQNTGDSFSVSQLLQTLFAPWRRIITYPGASFDARLRAWGDNLFSRIIGFVVRIVVLFTALATMAGVVLLTGLEIIIWPFLPIGVPTALILGFIL